MYLRRNLTDLLELRNYQIEPGENMNLFLILCNLLQDWQAKSQTIFFFSFSISDSGSISHGVYDARCTVPSL